LFRLRQINQVPEVAARIVDHPAKTRERRLANAAADAVRVLETLNENLEGVSHCGDPVADTFADFCQALSVSLAAEVRAGGISARRSAEIAHLLSAVSNVAHSVIALGQRLR
jgi:hypothetical protein